MSSTSNGELDPRYLPTDLAYIAGLFDGEGSISFRTQTIQTKLYGEWIYHNFSVSIANCSEDTLKWVQETMDIGGWIGSKWKNRNYICYRLDYHHGRAVRFMELVFPFLKIKREEAQLAIEFYQRCTRNGKHFITPDELEIRENIRLRLDELKSLHLHVVEYNG